MATPPAEDGFVIYGRLQGHKGQVLCVAAPDEKAGEALVATSAEDSTVRLWDLRDGGTAAAAAARGESGSSSSPRVAMCLCRCFGGEAVSSVVFGAGGATRLYCSAGGKVLEFDLRTSGGSRALLMTSPTAVFDDAEEEVNELAVHPKGHYLAAADDSGVVKVYNTRTRRVDKTLRNTHTSICHSVRFRPRASWDIASGALDSTLAFWDFSTGRVRRKLNFTEDLGLSSSDSSASSSSPQQLFNPPFVHSVDFTSDGRYLAAGLGDSGVVIVDAKTRAPVGRCDGHSAPISQVHYPSFASEILFSAGNDKRLLVWDQRQFVDQPNDLSGTHEGRDTHSGGGDSRVADDCTGAVGAVTKTKKSVKSGKKKGRAKNTAQRDIKTPPQTTSRPPGSDAGNERAKGREDGWGQGRAADSAGGPRERTSRSFTAESNPAGAEGRDAGIVRCSVPLLSMRLEEKPNWVSSFGVPYPAVVMADTSSVAKILRRHGT
ncbi:unnamed protein product [Scytosiphon promiscuus]